MKDVIISIERTLDTIIIETEHEFSGYITIGIVKGDDFYVKLEFTDLDTTKVSLLNKLFHLPKALKIESKIISKEQFPITHIVVETINADSDLNVTWDCLSDDPDFSLVLS
ncbi:hypothetical protein [Flavobacterium aestivum]|uniref:hypothetical protein n=1 Tax=Flavobacterium aestivum TaxID=3003257 RepID=UPI0022866D5C|nr:hypothetical protein [Flavobacterium aestivum]